jgi:putative hemolysin
VSADTAPPPGRRRRRLRKEAERDEVASQSDEIARNLSALSDIQITEVMTPRIDVETLTTPVSASDVAQAVRESGHSCYPVVLDDLDDVIGLLFVKDLFRAGKGDLLEGGAQLTTLEISKKVRPPLLLPESLDVLEALGELREERRSVALVVDEHGGVSGILSLKDLLEPLVGDLTDELAGEDEPEVVRVDAERWLVEGQITLDDLAEAIGLALPDGDYVTLGGFVLDELGDIPDEGESVDFDGWNLRVHSMEKRRIAEVLVRRPGMTTPERPTEERP